MKENRHINLSEGDKYIILKILDLNQKDEDDILEMRILIPKEKFGNLLGQRNAVECIKETFTFNISRVKNKAQNRYLVDDENLGQLIFTAAEHEKREVVDKITKQQLVGVSVNSIESDVKRLIELKDEILWNEAV